MKRALVDTLVCPLSGDGLRLVSSQEGPEIEEGELVCDGCDRHWAVHAGVPRLVPPDLADQQARTAAAFGWQWQHFSEMHREFEGQFRDWLDPIGPDSFADRRVLDAGCGTGRHAYFAARYGAREVIALDLSAAVEAACVNLRGLDNVSVVQGDLLRLPFRTDQPEDGFDLVYSIGVLHHLPDPRAGFLRLVGALRPGGTVAVWVYGYENNGIVRNVVEPLRRLSTRIPPSLLRGLAWPLAAGFHATSKGVYRPLHGTRVGRRLPLDDYLTSVADFSFRQNYAIVFDQLVAPTAAYIRGPALASWFDDAGLVDVHVTSRHGNSWRGRGRVPD